MKTSFYIVVWIMIYPILDLFNNSLINDNAFFVALIVVWGLSWLINNRLIPDTLIYEDASQKAPLMEDIYTGNINSFKKRITTDTVVETITSLYFVVTIAFIIMIILNTGGNDWLEVIVFGFFTIASISRSIPLIKARHQLQENPTQQECTEIVDEVYKLDYSEYYNVRSCNSYENTLPPKPKHYKAFRIFSIIIALVATFLGVLLIAFGIDLMFSIKRVEAATAGVIQLLYGSLAAYFGIRDFISCLQTNKSKD